MSSMSVPLPIECANTVTGRDVGVFQVFGQAEGFGFAWRPQKWFYPRPKPANITYEPEHRDPPRITRRTTRSSSTCNSPPAAHLSGTIVDDRGNPLPSVRLEIRACESLKVVDNVIPGWTLDALNETDSVPASMKIRTTDAQGRFDFTGLPVDCRFWIHVRARGFPGRSFYAATTDGPQPDHDGTPVLTGEIKVRPGDTGGRTDQDGLRRHRQAGAQGRGASGQGLCEYPRDDRRPGPRHLEAPAGNVSDGELAGPRHALPRHRGRTRCGGEPRRPSRS